MAKQKAKKPARLIRTRQMDSRVSDIQSTPGSPRGSGQAWTCDVALVHTIEGWIYRALVLDLYSREVLGWATATDKTKALAVSALSKAIRLHKPAPGSILYVNQSKELTGSQVQRLLITNRLVVCKANPRMN